MDLVDEYFVRHKASIPFVKYADKSQLILQHKDKKPGWINVDITSKNEPNHPAFYNFSVFGSPVIYTTPDFNHFSQHHEKLITEQRWEWDQYETNLVEWARQISVSHRAVRSNDAVVVCWQMFLINYDSWLANFVPCRLLPTVHKSIFSESAVEKLAAIKKVELWLNDRHDRVCTAWSMMRRQLDAKNYADWLADLVNSFGG